MKAECGVESLDAGLESWKEETTRKDRSIVPLVHSAHMGLSPSADEGFAQSSRKDNIKTFAGASLLLSTFHAPGKIAALFPSHRKYRASVSNRHRRLWTLAGADYRWGKRVAAAGAHASLELAPQSLPPPFLPWSRRQTNRSGQRFPSKGLHGKEERNEGRRLLLLSIVITMSSAKPASTVASSLSYLPSFRPSTYRCKVGISQRWGFRVRTQQSLTNTVQYSRQQMPTSLTCLPGSCYPAPLSPGRADRLGHTSRFFAHCLAPLHPPVSLHPWPRLPVRPSTSPTCLFTVGCPTWRPGFSSLPVARLDVKNLPVPRTPLDLRSLDIVF
ncbi:hypothetical protein MPTK1_2g00130 [Marchantia polymorpha subsp. ruderalis]|uniref:Uncharacterized protein n=1 Tax=Marchantia polymorpha TaxID=3197 RepID=A0A2R6X9R5_MARPO|nr:hypothetical protein MARPO_0028s0138 [Marchantia polymorpha]BBN00549.1 hypothetical protein Mp_2g00130 [Marchantia polymorpha subsp. ruderalis]|eukprot:PTQ42848.1 hypothetical protein MARPO_0028s0138 [Marchantia polymorpha]